MIKPKATIAKIKRIQEEEPLRFYKVRLDRNERTFPFSERFMKRIRQRLNGEWIMTYPDSRQLYEKFADFIKQPSKRLIFNNGSDQSIKAIFETYVSKGDKILLHKPGYAMFSIYSEMFRAKVEYKSFDARLRFDFEAYIEKINSSFRMAVLENPNGFIGVAPSKEMLVAFVRRCEKEGVIAVIDEAYFFFHDITAAGLLDSFENLIIVRTFSKAWGIAGLRAGYILSNGKNIRNIYKVKPMHEINSFAILVLDELLNKPKEVFDFVADTRKSLNFLKVGFKNLGIAASDSVANFLAVCLGRHISDMGALRIMMRYEGIFIRRPFRERSLSDWIRIGTGPLNCMQRLLTIIKDILIKER